MTEINHWDRKLVGLARHISTWSKDPSTKCGAVIARPDHTIASVGFNGFPKGTDDDPALYDDRPTKYLRVVHAEQNAIVHAQEKLEGYTIYVTHPPCADCAGLIIQSGITRVKSNDHSEDFRDRWSDSNTQASSMFHEAGVKVSYI
jgi:dCMP deaminase